MERNSKNFQIQKKIRERKGVNVNEFFYHMIMN